MSAGTKKFDEFLEKFREGLVKSGSDKGFFFDDIFPTLKETYLAASRKELIAELKKLAQKSQVMANEWVPLVTRIDFLVAAERDLQMRYRSRIGSMRNCLKHRTFVDTTLGYITEKLTKVEGSRP